jgi:ribosomal protein S24E
MKLLQDKQNELLNRKEVKIVIEAGKNPTFDEATEVVSKEFKSDKEAIKVKKVMGRFGRNTFLITANIYKNKQDLEKTEPKTKKEIEAEKKAAEEAKKAEEQPPEQPKEEKKQEKPEENKEEN